MRPQHLCFAGSRERDFVRKALVQNAGQRVLIGSSVRRRTLDLLGSEVVERADELAALSRAASGGVLAEAEVAEVGVPGCGRSGCCRA